MNNFKEGSDHIIKGETYVKALRGLIVPALFSVPRITDAAKTLASPSRVWRSYDTSLSLQGPSGSS